MRLNLNETAPADHPRSRRDPAEARFGLFGPLYCALWLNAAALAVMVYAGRAPQAGLLGPRLALAGWAAILALLATLACLARIPLHDLLLTLSVRDRFLLGLLTLIPVVLPAMMRGPRVIPDGLLWAVPLMLLLAVTPALTRRLLALTLLGAWGAAARLDGPAGLVLTLGFGLTWLTALGAVHFAHTGEPHGLGGMWPVRKVVGNALLTAIPAAIAAAAAWMAWPKPSAPAAGLHAPHRPLRPIARLDTLERAELIYWGVATIAVTLLAIVLLHYIRKWLLRRSARAVAVKLVPGQVAQVEYQAEPLAPEERPHLGGLRGRIVALWVRWAAAAGQAATPRAPGETAAAYAARLAAQASGPQAPPAMTALLERAHYGQAEPKKEDADAMTRLVREELAKLKQAEGKNIQ